MLPKLIVFDLDFTLWDCDGTWCDCLSPPFGMESGVVMDSTKRPVTLYPDVKQILEQCKALDCEMALASRTEQPAWALSLIDLLGITSYFAFSEIYPSSKVMHFSSLKKASRFEFSQMLFFDDESRNISEVSSRGVACVHVTQGLNQSLFDASLQRFQQNHFKK